MDTRSILPELVLNRAEQAPDRIAIEQVSGLSRTAAEVATSMRRWASSLKELGVTSSQGVGTMMPTTATAVECWLGIGAARAVEVPFNTEYRGDYLAALINRAHLKVMVVSQAWLEPVLEAARACGDLAAIVVPDVGRDRLRAPETPATGPRVLAADEFFTDGPGTYDRPLPSDPAGIIFTSGTTGRSKGVRVPWRQLAQAVHCNFPGDGASQYENGGYYCPWSLANILGKGACDIATRLGLRLVLRQGFSLSAFWPDIRFYRCTHAVLPFIAPWVWREPEGPDDADNPLRRVVLAPMLPEYRAFERRFAVRVSTGWATTEAGYPITTSDPVDAATCGRLVPGYELRVADEYDEDVGPGREGQLLVRHDRPWHQMDGYLDDAEATAQAWRNGWFHTGDIFKYDRDGNYYFTGRMKDYIKHRGHNISAFEVESAAGSHPEIIECACVGVASDLAGVGDFEDQDLVLLVVKEPGSTLTGDEIRAYAAAKLPAFMVPAHVRFVPSLPKGELNKLDRKQLAWHAGEPADA